MIDFVSIEYVGKKKTVATQYAKKRVRVAGQMREKMIGSDVEVPFNLKPMTFVEAMPGGQKKYSTFEPVTEKGNKMFYHGVPRHLAQRVVSESKAYKIVEPVAPSEG